MPNNCAAVKVIDVSSVAAKVTGTATGASLTAAILIAAELAVVRSEERRVGKEGRSRWSPDH